MIGRSVRLHVTDDDEGIIITADGKPLLRMTDAVAMSLADDLTIIAEARRRAPGQAELFDARRAS